MQLIQVYGRCLGSYYEFYYLIFFVSHQIGEHSKAFS